MKRSLNLMSERSRKRGQARNCLRLWTRIFAGLLLVLTATGFAQWQVCHQEQQKRAAAEAEYDPIRELQAENRRLQKQIDSLHEAERIPLELAKHRPLLGLIGLATQAVAAQDGKIYLRQLEIEREPLVLKKAQNEKARKSKLRFALEGNSADSTAVTRLADTLRKTGPFADVKLSTNKVSHVGKQAQQAFAVQCTN